MFVKCWLYPITFLAAPTVIKSTGTTEKLRNKERYKVSTARRITAMFTTEKLIHIHLQYKRKAKAQRVLPVILMITCW